MIPHVTFGEWMECLTLVVFKKDFYKEKLLLKSKIP